MKIPTSASGITAEWLASLLPNAAIRSVSARRFAEDRGTSGLLFEVRAEMADGPRELVVKAPHPSQWERSLREIRFLETVDLPLHAARLISSEVDSATSRTALVLAHVQGEDGDAVAGPSPGNLKALVHDLAVLHSTFRTPEALEKLDWLPTWGQGTKGADRPHKRRMLRYVSLSDRFLDHHAPGSPPWVTDLLAAVGRRLEHRLTDLASLPPTLIHADVHLDNIVFRKETPYWLDWQSASRGPGIYDLVRLLGETVDITADLPLARRLVHAYAGHLTYHGVPEDEVEYEISHLPSMAAAVLAGFVSGYGSKPPENTTERERAIIARAVSEAGLFGFVRHLLCE